MDQVFFTTPGERVKLPTFGRGLMQFVFAFKNNEMAAATQFSIRRSLHQRPR
jgi:hypothetical protein